MKKPSLELIGDYVAEAGRLILGIAFFAASFHAHGSDFSTGLYEAHEGWGSLMITKDTNSETKRFSIGTLGPDGHSCSVEGILKNGKIFPVWRGEPTDCNITFKQTGPAIEVSAEGDGCRDFCGSRASFDSVYTRPIKVCMPSARRDRRAKFLSQYQKKNYKQAYEGLDRFRRECENRLTWMELDQVRNDLAITLFHLGRLSECRLILSQNRAADITDTEDLKGGLAPFDYNNYLPVAEATWYNMKRCGSGP